MGRVVDILEQKLEELTQDVNLILNKRYMIGIVEDLEEELPPFKDFLKYLYEKKTMQTVNKSKTKEVQMPLLRDEIFHPVIKDNVSSSDLVKQVVPIAVEAFLHELRDTKKATCEYLSSS